jgi:hypothetical protein
VTAKSTHEAVRNALSAPNSPVRGRDYEIYLQGSYKNDTNIRGDSDVDIVVQLNETFWKDISGLNAQEQTACEQAFGPATYSLDAFDADVQRSLRAYFGASSVTPNNKCIIVVGGSGRLDADVVVAGQYRRYTNFRSTSDQQYAEGITFWGRNDSQQVINYPKLHYDNGVGKNAATNGNYKRSVRMIKNARTYLAQRATIDAALAPSYFVEGWLFNVPDDQFVSESDHAFYNILNWLEQNSEWRDFVCQNWQFYLFGPLQVQWSVANGKQLHGALVTLWHGWGS